MEVHLIRSSLLIAICYFLYLILVRRGTFFLVNRIYLLTGILLAIMLPFIPKFNLGTASLDIVNLIDGIELTGTVEGAGPDNTPDLINPVMIIYLSGVTWFMLRFLSGLGRIVYLCLRFPRSTVNGLTTVELQEDQAPFTFFNILFISKFDMDHTRDTGMLQHELAHIQLVHSLDVMIAEISCIVFWFNPFIWLLKSALKTEHEYAADDRVVREGYNQLCYQRTLLNRTMGASVMSLANNFNYSLLKNRILMMTKYKLSWKNRWKYFLVFPLMVLFFTCSLNNSDIAQDNNDEVFDIAEVMPEFPGGMMEFRKFIAQNLIYPPVAAEKGVEAKIWLQFVVSEDGSVQDPVIVRTDIEEEVDNEIVVVGYTREMVEASSQKDALLALEEEALRVTKSVPHFKPGMNEGKAVKVRYTFPIVFVLQ